MKKIKILVLLLWTLLSTTIIEAKCTGCACVVDVSKFLACEASEEDVSLVLEERISLFDLEKLNVDQDKFITLIFNHEEVMLISLDSMSKEIEHIKLSAKKEKKIDSSS